ncbi:permease [Fusibacter ferrireducens]|uniref:Permease n=1 Tax=Fusibacter ferrireducens TaxID=2785058 RepID=A0ABR9ZW04_9FIRM|nr:permease [Fusibacter ferrireducens]MBF4694171.1 permease [Fusibacter ferrireducens]
MNQNLRGLIKKYKWALLTAIILTIINIAMPTIGANANKLTLSNFLTMLGVLPPILLLIGLLDVWVPKEIMIKYMGEHSGIKGLGIALILGSFAAGPLYAAFPVAAILLKKRARLSYVMFFLGVWSTAKLPMVMFEYTSFGGLFTFLHITTNLTVFLIGALLIEKMLTAESKEAVYQSASALSE